MIIYHDDLRFHADEWTPLHALHSSQKGTMYLGFFKKNYFIYQNDKNEKLYQNDFAKY